MPMLTSTRKETTIRSAPNHASKTAPGMLSPLQALQGLTEDMPGQARNAANRSADGKFVQGEPGSGLRHRRGSRDSGSGVSRVFVLDRRGVHSQRIAVRACGLINVRPASGTVQGVTHRHRRILQRGDGHGYSLDTTRKKETSTMHGTRDPAFLLAPKDGDSCGAGR